MRKTVKQAIAYAEQRSAYWLAEANARAEAGNHKLAEIMYQKSARWLMRANDLIERGTKNQ